jgi:transposase
VTLTAGHRHEATKADELVEHAQGKAFVADAGYDADRIREALKAKRIKAVIANGSGRAKKRRVEKKFYRRRYLVECFFHRLKLFRAIATRYEKTARNYLSLVSLVCAWLWLN